MNYRVEFRRIIELRYQFHRDHTTIEASSIREASELVKKAFPDENEYKIIALKNARAG